MSTGDFAIKRRIRELLEESSIEDVLYSFGITEDEAVWALHEAGLLDLERYFESTEESDED